MLIQPQDTSQIMIFTSFDDFIQSEHPVRVIKHIIDSILKTSQEEYTERGDARTGRPAYSTDTLLKIFIYGYINRITSSRRLEQETKRNIELMWLTGCLRPDHKTISDFRKDNKQLIKNFSRDIKLFLKGLGLISTATIAVDGTKLKANASRDMVKKDDVINRLKELERELEQYLSQMDEQDSLDTLANHDELHPEKERTYQSKINTLEKEIAGLKKSLSIMKDKGHNYLSKTDRDCNMMQTRDGVIPAYNAQIATETENKFIVNESITDEANDKNQLKPAVESVEEELSTVVGTVIVDSGYCNYDVIQEIELNKDRHCFVTTPKVQNRTPEITFTYDKGNDCYRCSQGQLLTLKHRNKKAKNSFVNVYVGQNCDGCPIRNQCTGSKQGRHISRFWNHDFRQEYRERMKEPLAAQMSKLRKSSIEHVFGTMKTWLGKIPLLTRGIESVATEISLFAASYNIKRLLSLFSFDKIMSMIKAYYDFIIVKLNEIHQYLTILGPYFTFKNTKLFVYNFFIVVSTVVICYEKI